MRATVIVDNIKNNEIPGEWGLCIYIEYGDKKVLLDTGASSLFTKNAKKLDLPLEDADMAVLSHAHYDHANGMEDFFKINNKAKFYLRDGCAENCYAKKWIFSKYIGLPKGILTDYSDRIEFASGDVQIADGIWIIGHKTDHLDLLGKREKMYQKRNHRWYPDDFSHEQSLVFETEKGLVVFNSCSHGGAANIIHEVSQTFPEKKVYALIGGFHIFNKTESEVRELANKIKDTGIEYVCTGHCTGKQAYGILKEELGDILHQLKVGMQMEF